MYLARHVILLVIYTGSFLQAERTGYLLIAVVGGAVAGVLESLIQTGRIFVVSSPASALTKVFSTLPFLTAVIVVGVYGISWPTILAYAVPWLLGGIAVFTFDTYQRGA